MPRLLASVFILVATIATCKAEPLTLEPHDHVCFVGNALAERMQHEGWLEMRLQSLHPKHQLVIRNLGFGGDELTIKLRSQDFGSEDDWLTRCGADVVFAFYGYNESFADEAGLAQFKTNLRNYLQHLKGGRYNGKSAPRVVLVSPIAAEDLNDPNLPDAASQNRRLALYTQAMAETAQSEKCVFVDLFQPTLAQYRQAGGPLTINGVHLNERGDRIVSEIITKSLFGPDALPYATADLDALRGAIQDKNFTWFQRYRTVDGFSIYGGRADLSFVEGQTNRVVMQREMEILDAMTANRDRRVWALAKGETLSIDDKNLLEFLPVTTNKPGRGPNGTHLFHTGEAAIERMQLADGLQINLFASEEQFPELANPVQMAFDPRGRLFVATMPSYPHWKPGEVMNDKIVVLEDTNGDGRADKSTVFADGLHVPTGLEFYGNGLLVGQQPDLMLLKDTTGDGVADVRERVLNGIDSADTHHALNSFVLDPGGALYFQEGTFHHTQVETPWGPPVRSANAGVFRYEPRSGKFDVYVAYDFANPHGHVFDRWGTDFVTDGTGNVNYYAPPFSGHIDFPNKHPGMEPFFQQRVRPCAGTEVLSSRHFPDENQGNYLVANVIGFHGILQYKIVPEGSGFKGVEVEPIVQSSDQNFRPTDIEMGPDGAIYFSDWQNPIIGHMQHNLRDPSRDRTHGRIYRVTCANRPLLTPPKIAGEPLTALLDALKLPEDRARHRARIELASRDSAEVLAATGRWVESLDARDKDYEHHLLEALWLHQSHNIVNEKLLRRMLRSSEPRARAASTRVLCYWADRLPDALSLLATQVEDAHPQVRLEAIRACSFFRSTQAADVALRSLKQPTDYYLTYTLTETMRQLEPYWRSAIAKGESFAADNPAGVDYVLGSVGTAELVKLPRTKLLYHAFLTRADVPAEFRQEALASLAKLNRTSVTEELLAALTRLDQSDSGTADAVLNELAQQLIGPFQPTKSDNHAHHHHGAETISLDSIRAARAQLETLSSAARRNFVRQICLVTLIALDQKLDPTWDRAAAAHKSLLDVVSAVSLFPSPALRAAAHDRLLPLLTGLPRHLRPEAGVPSVPSGRFVRVELPRAGTLTLAEVQVFSGGQNVALGAAAKQSSTDYGGAAARAVDGRTSGDYGSGTQTHTREGEQNPWWEVDLRRDVAIESVAIWNRSEGNGQFAKRLDGFTLVVLDASRAPIFRSEGNPAPVESVQIELPADPAGALRRAAMLALVTTGRDQAATFATLAGMIRENSDRGTAVKALGRLPQVTWPKDAIPPLLEVILTQTQALVPAERTSVDVRDALQLANELAMHLPATESQKARRALRELGVPVLLVRPVPHLMLFDRTDLYAEAGRPVEIVFENIDIMPHNLIITAPGMLERVGIEAEKMAADPAAFERHFRPTLDAVLFGTRLLQPRQAQRQVWTAPTEPGDYPFVCTFPGHWRRMYGTLHVVRSLDDVPADLLAAASRAPTAATARPFVRAWKKDDLTAAIDKVQEPRDMSRGKQLFSSLSCVQCHKVGPTAGGEVGPNLAQVKEKLSDGKIKPLDVLIEMLEPSAVIDQKFATHVLELKSGKAVSGMIVSRSETEIRLRQPPVGAAPDAPPVDVVVPVAEIEEQFTSKVSLMPQGLLNTLSEDEIWDLVAFVISGGM